MNFQEYYLTEESKLLYHGSPYSFDKFDMSKVGTGDGLNKYGYGLYFADSISLAEYYARENFLPKNDKHTGMDMYKVKINGIENFYAWDELIPEDLYFKIANLLEEKGFQEDADRMKEEFEGYHETYTMDQTYGILKDIFKNDKSSTQFLFNIGVYGTIADDIHNRGKIYVAFSDNIIKIVGQWTLGEENDD